MSISIELNCYYFFHEQKSKSFYLNSHLMEVENHHPKNRSIALLTMPELRIGVVGVPVMSLALCAVLYAT